MTIAQSIPADARIDVATLLPEGRHIINGDWIEAHGGETIAVLNPATQEVIASVPRGGESDIDAAVKAAEAALPEWKAMSPVARAQLLYRWADLCERHEAELDIIECLEVGHGSLRPSLIPGMFRYTAGLADKIEGQSLATTSLDQMALTLRDPFGVCGILIPWNGPGWSFPKRVAAPLAAGNTVVVKPAEDAPLTLLYMIKLAHEAGFPPGVINAVCGYGPEAGDALTGHHGVRKISFTGSGQTGTRVMQRAAEHLAPVHLELGGKSPQVVFPDAPMDAAVRAITLSIVANTGQACAAGSRVIVHEDVHDELVERLRESFAKVKVGPWYEQGAMGPLINEKQGRRVLDFIATGSSEGATLAFGGKRLSGGVYDGGWFVEPTLFTDVTPDMTIAQEEIFGPVLAVIKVGSEEEALSIANGTRYGLVSAVWTSDAGRAVRMARRLEAGLVSINTFMGMGALGVPAGGFKQSGFGRIAGTDSIHEWTQTKAVVFGAS